MPPGRPTSTQSRPSSWSMPPGTSRAVRRPPAPRSLRPVATGTSTLPPERPHPSSLHDFKFVIGALPGPCGLEQRAQGLDRAALPPDDATELRRVDRQLEDHDPIFLERGDADRLGMVHEVARHGRHPGPDIRCRQRVSLPAEAPDMERPVNYKVPTSDGVGASLF